MSGIIPLPNRRPASASISAVPIPKVRYKALAQGLYAISKSILSLQLFSNSSVSLFDLSPSILKDLMIPIPSAKSRTSSVRDSASSCFITECPRVVLSIRLPIMTKTSTTSAERAPSRISITNIIRIIKPWDTIKDTSSDNTPMQFSSMNTMSVDKTALILPIFPSVKYPIGSFLKWSPSLILISANTL